MKKHFNSSVLVFLLSAILAGCSNYKKLITDEVVLKDGNTQTGTIRECDSVNLKIEKIDESKLIIPWTSINTVKGKKLKSLWVGINLGYYKVPYFSVFRNESMTAEKLGAQYKIGLAYRGNKLYYINLSHLSAKPYAVTKFGVGYQHYIGQTTYLKNNSYFVGGEFNFMNAKYNNGVQTTIEPFTGFERKYKEHLRYQFKFGLQFNLANKNSNTGVNLTIGATFMKRNFKKYYDILNQEHRVYKK